MKKTLIMIFALSMLVACSGNKGKEVEEPTPAIDMSNLDTSVSPGEDFYKYATGGWQEKNPLENKPEYSRYGTFEVLAEVNEERLKGIFDNIGKETHKAGSPGQKIADLYALGMDSLRLNSEGAGPLKPYIEEIQAIADKDELIRTVANIHKNGDDPFFGIYIGSDLKDSNTNVEYLGQDGLGMGDRDYYIDPENAHLKEGYRKFLAKVAELAGIDDAEQVANDALEIEDAIAKVQWSRVEQRDTWKSYNPTAFGDILAKYPALRFDIYTEAVGIEPQDTIIVEEPSYFVGLNAILNDTPLEKLKNYLLAQVVQGGASLLSDEFYDASFDFFSRQMSGIQEQRPRWKRTQSRVGNVLSEAVGQLFVEKYFSEADKERMKGLVANIQQSLSQRIANLDWMSDATKAKAQEKLSNFVVKIGYPDKWKDYSALDIDPELSYYENMVRASNWRAEENLSKLGKPVDKTEWHMSPQTVNAYYNPTSNEICFPAAILQPPFYNTDADDAVNYGAIGVVISHEMTHGFDDQGRNFDKDGNMVDWWAPEDVEAFNEKTKKFVAQFDEVEVLPGVFANGALCLGENLADLGGLNIAFDAMQASFGGNRPEPIDGLTPEQRFYLAYANVWAQNMTDEEIARRTKVDVHSIGRNRVNVTIRNLGSFFDAFGIKEGDNMYRPEEDRVVIW